jgi:hypothetical protein
MRSDCIGRKIQGCRDCKYRKNKGEDINMAITHPTNKMAAKKASAAASQFCRKEFLLAQLQFPGGHAKKSASTALSWYSQSTNVEGLDPGFSRVFKVQSLDPGFLLPSSVVFMKSGQKSRDFSFCTICVPCTVAVRLTQAERERYNCLCCSML